MKRIFSKELEIVSMIVETWRPLDLIYPVNKHMEYRYLSLESDLTFSVAVF